MQPGLQVWGREGTSGAEQAAGRESWGGLVEGFPDLRQFGIFQLCLTQLKATKTSQKLCGQQSQQDLLSMESWP